MKIKIFSKVSLSMKVLQQMGEKNILNWLKNTFNQVIRDNISKSFLRLK